MAHEKKFEPVAGRLAVDAESRHLIGQRFSGSSFERFERVDHVLRSGQFGAARIRYKFPFSAEPHHDYTGQDAEDDLRDEGRDEKSDAVAFFFIFRMTRSTK